MIIEMTCEVQCAGAGTYCRGDVLDVSPQQAALMVKQGSAVMARLRFITKLGGWEVVPRAPREEPPRPEPPPPEPQRSMVRSLDHSPIVHTPNITVAPALLHAMAICYGE